MSLFESIKDLNSESFKVDYNQHYVQDAAIKKFLKNVGVSPNVKTLKVCLAKLHLNFSACKSDDKDKTAPVCVWATF